MFWKTTGDIPGNYWRQTSHFSRGKNNKKGCQRTWAHALNRESSLSGMGKFYAEPEGPLVCFFMCHHREAASCVPGHVEAETFSLYL